MDKQPLILTHAGCADGATAALMAYMKFGEQAEYAPANYSQRAPDNEVVAGRKVFILDFCYRPAEIARLEQVCDLLVLDHHASQAADFRGYSGPVFFDLERCGASLAWLHFHSEPGQTIQDAPEFVRYIEDHDLYKFELPHSREIRLALQSLGGRVDFRKWLPVFLHWQEWKERLIHEGSILLVFNEELLAGIVSNRYGMKLLEQSAIACNSCTLISDVGDRLLAKHNTDLAVIYHWRGRDKRWSVSLRSTTEVDCSVIAKHFGGGGHPRAAAFSCKELPWGM